MAKLSVFCKINLITQIFLFIGGMILISLNEVESKSYPRAEKVSEIENVQYEPMLFELVKAYQNGPQTWEIFKGKTFKITGVINYIENEDYQTSIILRTRFPAFNPKFRLKDSSRGKAFWLGKGYAITLVCVAKDFNIRADAPLGNECVLANYR